MNKGPDWLEYAHVGLASVQAAQLSTVSRQLVDLAQETQNLRRLAEDQAKAAIAAQELEQANRQRLQQLRQVIFIAEQFMDKLEAGIEEKKNLVSHSVYVRQLESTLHELGLIPPTAVDDWQDMDRAGKLAGQISALSQKLSSRMPKDHFQQAETCWQFIQQDRELTDLCRRRAELEVRRESLELAGISLNAALTDCKL